MLHQNFQEKADIEKLRKEYIKDFEVNNNFFSINDSENNHLDDAFQDLTFNIKDDGIRKKKEIPCNHGENTEKEDHGEIFTQNMHSNANEEKYMDFHHSLKGLLKDDTTTTTTTNDDDDDEIIEKIEYIKEEFHNTESDHKSSRNKTNIEKKEEITKSNEVIRNDKITNSFITNKNSNGKTDNNINITNESNCKNVAKISSNNFDNIKTTTKPKNDDDANTTNPNICSEIKDSQSLNKVDVNVINNDFYNDHELEYPKNDLTYRLNYDRNTIPLENNPTFTSNFDFDNTNKMNSKYDINNISYPKNIIKNKDSTEKLNTLEQSICIRDDDDDELLKRYEEMKKKISYLSSHGYNEIINKFSFHSNNTNKGYKKTTEFSSSNNNYSSHEESKDNISVIYSIENSYVSNSSSPSCESNNYGVNPSLKNENSKWIRKVNKQEEQIKNLKEDLKVKTNENNNLNNQISELKIKIEDTTHRHNLELSNVRMEVITEKSKLDSQMSDILHKCSLHESTIKNKDKIIDDLKIQLDVLNEGTFQKLKSLENVNKKNIKLYNDVQAELILMKKSSIQQKQNYEIEIHNLKFEIEKIQDLASREKQEALKNKEQLEKEKSNLKNKLNEVENEKDRLKVNIEKKDKKIKELDDILEINIKKNKSIKKKNLELEQQMQLYNQEKIFIKKKYCKELMKIKKINQEISNSLENKQNQHQKDTIEYKEKIKALTETLKEKEIQNEKKCNSYISKIESQNKIIQEYEIQLTEMEQHLQSLKDQYEKEIEKKKNKMKEVEKKSRAFLSYIQNQTNGLL